MTEVKIGGKTLPAAIAGWARDPDWDDRESRAVTVTLDWSTAQSLFRDGAAWGILVEEGAHREEYDCSRFSVAGDLTDHRDGTVTAKMGCLTELEETLAMIYGGEAG